MQFRHAPRRARLIAAGIAAVTLSGVIVATSAARGATPPPNPSDGQISAAARAKAQISDEVGQISAHIAVMQGQLSQLQANEELAEQKYVYAYSQLQTAQLDAKKARVEVADAKKQVRAAQRQFRVYALANYESGQVGGTTGTLLTAQDPNALLQQSAMQNYVADHQVDAMDKLQAATIAKSNADAHARAAVTKRTDATKAAALAKQAADQALASAQQQKQELDASLATQNAALSAARLHLATLNNERAAYIKYQKHQAYLAHQRWLAHQRQIAWEQQHQQNSGGSADSGSGGGSGSSTGGGSTGGGTAPVTSGNQAAIRQDVVNRAMRWIGWMYAWAGGNASGPTYGVCAGDGAENDCHIQGFDCSGLALYAWAPYVSMPHYSASQYLTSSDHPTTSNLQLGDLVFWSSNGTVAGIHHVAIYIGNGMVVQAPESGETIKTTPLDEVDWGYYGATDPLG